MEKIAQAKAGFRSLTEAIDTTSPGGRMMMQIVGSFAEFERAMLRERTRNGLDAARKQGRVGGRRPKLKTHQKKEIIHLVDSGKKTAAEAARLFGVHPSTVSRLLQRDRVALTRFYVPLLPKPPLGETFPSFAQPLKLSQIEVYRDSQLFFPASP